MLPCAKWLSCRLPIPLRSRSASPPTLLTGQPVGLLLIVCRDTEQPSTPGANLKCVLLPIRVTHEPTHPLRIPPSHLFVTLRHTCSAYKTTQEYFNILGGRKSDPPLLHRTPYLHAPLPLECHCCHGICYNASTTTRTCNEADTMPTMNCVNAHPTRSVCRLAARS